MSEEALQTPSEPIPDPLNLDKLNPKELSKLDACIHCGMCLPSCPTYRVTGSEAESPRGRLYLMRAASEGRLDSPDQLSDHLDPCLGCMGCMTACPSGVDYHSLLMTSRKKLVTYQPESLRKWRRFWLSEMLPNRRRMAQLAMAVKLYQKTGLQSIVRGLKLARLAGRFGQLEPFTPTIQPGKPLETGQTFGTNQKGKVVLFIGCIMNAAFSQTHHSTIKVLTANGYQVIIPEQTCCGALAYHSGEVDIAADLARNNIDWILREKPDWIVVNAAGCGSTLKEVHHLVSGSPAKAFAEKVVDILELLAKHPLEGKLKPVELTVTYHAACHLHHAQKVQQEPYAVLDQIPGLVRVPLTEAEMCCGSAGVYNLAHPELSQEILDMKLTHLKQTRAQAVLAGNPGCALQLETGIRQSRLNMQVLHPIDLIAQAYD